MRGTTADYARRVLCDPSRGEANARTIAEAFGFCLAHAGHLLGIERRASDIAAVMKGAAAAAGDLLGPGAGHEDRLLDLLFGAAQACPACRHSGRRLAGLLARHAAALRSSMRGAARPPPPCLPHFRALVAMSEQADLRSWIVAEIDFLSAVVPSADAAPVVAGLPDVPCAGFDGPTTSGCPICAAMQRARARWLESAKVSAQTGLVPWAVLPGCAEHLWACALSGDSRLAIGAVEHAIDAALGTLRRAVSWLDKEDRRLELEARSVFYRPRSPAFVLGQRRKALRGLWRCAACERMAAARERAVGALLERLSDKRRREEFERGYGLCMKHFAEVRLVAPAGTLRETLTALHAAKLRALEQDLAGGTAAWKESICRFSGSV